MEQEQEQGAKSGVYAREVTGEDSQVHSGRDGENTPPVRVAPPLCSAPPASNLISLRLGTSGHSEWAQEERLSPAEETTSAV
jgi:hypothetical protein